MDALDRVIVLIKPGVDKEATVSVLRDKYGYTSEELLLSEGVGNARSRLGEKEWHCFRDSVRE